MTIFFCFFCCVDLAQFANCAKFVFFGAKKVVYLRNKCKKIPPSCIVTWRVPSLVLLYRVWHHLACVAVVRMVYYANHLAYGLALVNVVDSGENIFGLAYGYLYCLYSLYIHIVRFHIISSFFSCCYCSYSMLFDFKSGIIASIWLDVGLLCGRSLSLTFFTFTNLIFSRHLSRKD